MSPEALGILRRPSEVLPRRLSAAFDAAWPPKAVDGAPGFAAGTRRTRMTERTTAAAAAATTKTTRAASIFPPRGGQPPPPPPLAPCPARVNLERHNVKGESSGRVSWAAKRRRRRPRSRRREASSLGLGGGAGDALLAGVVFCVSAGRATPPVGVSPERGAARAHADARARTCWRRVEVALLLGRVLRRSRVVPE